MSRSWKHIRKTLPPPFSARHFEYSMLFSMDDEVSRASEELMSSALEAIRLARGVSLGDVAERMEKPPYYPEVWPGEHYRLLAGFVQARQPRRVVEIGTRMGLSALSMGKYLSPDAKLYTFDIVPWKSFGSTCLRESDFAEGKLIQIVDDLSKPETMLEHRRLIEDADLLFIDAAKDGITEKNLLDNLETIQLSRKMLVIFDDIRLWNMLKVWRDIRRPKLDLTSFGHWSGTGVVEWNPPV